jgi:hypothetical protein
VRLDTETVTEKRQVSEEVRKEHIEVDGDQDQLGRQDQRQVELGSGKAVWIAGRPSLLPTPRTPWGAETRT